MAASGDGVTSDDERLFEFMHAQGFSALGLMAEIQPPAHLVDEALKVKHYVVEAVADIKDGNVSKEACTRNLLRAAYMITDLAYKCSATIPLPTEDTFVAICFGRGVEDEEEKRLASLLPRPGMLDINFGPGVGDGDAASMRAVMSAMNRATYATARFIWTLP